MNYNVKEFLQNLIHSIKSASKNLTFEIIIVDNASSDGSPEFIKEKFPEVKFIRNTENKGFSKANNQGLAIAQGKYLLLINPDTLVSEDTFGKMIEFFESTPSAGLAGCKILNPDGTLQLACRRSFPGPWTSFCKVTGLSSMFPKSRLFARYNLTYLDEDKTYEVDAISGSFMMMTREAYEKVGGLDEQFFMYGEDLDLCYRFQKAGYKVFYVHSTQIIHYKGESTKRSSFDETRVFYEAMHLFVKKHLSTSFLVEIILRSAIVLREFFTFVARRKVVFISLLLDFLVYDITLLGATFLYSRFIHWRGFPYYSYGIILTIPALLHIIIAAIFKVYKRDSLSVIKNFGAVFFSFFIISSLTFFFKQYAYSRATVLITYFFLFFTLSFWRIFVRIFFKIGLKSEELARRKTIIVGTGKLSVGIAEKLKTKSTAMHIISGLISSNNAEIGKTIEGFEVIGSIDNIRKIVREKKIDEIIFLSEEIPYNKMMSVVSNCQGENVDFKLIGNNLDFLVGKTSVTLLDDFPLIDINYNISSPFHKTIKSIFDYSLASAVLLLIYPFIYLTVKLTGRKNEFRNFILNVPKIYGGKVSFVGPHSENEKDKLFLGKKGLTGFWYVEDAVTMENERSDLFYAKNQNIWLDIEILGKTLNKMWADRS